MPNLIDTVQVDRVMLERFECYADQYITDQEVIQATSLRSMVDIATRNLVLSLRSSVYGEHGPEYEHIITLAVPANWWEHLKLDLAARWPRLKIAYKTKRVPYTFWIKPSAWYPSLSEADGPRYKAIAKLQPLRVQGLFAPEITR